MKLNFLRIFNDVLQNSRTLEKILRGQGTSLKAVGLTFWILALYICILAPVKQNLKNPIKWRDDYAAPGKLGLTYNMLTSKSGTTCSERIRLTFNLLKELREQDIKALPQIKKNLRLAT